MARLSIRTVERTRESDKQDDDPHHSYSWEGWRCRGRGLGKGCLVIVAEWFGARWIPRQTKPGPGAWLWCSSIQYQLTRGGMDPTQKTQRYR
ncbi:unnamed protein product [Fusarium graminearum]|uniref:Chromosome 1, complete genome n=1 Tax=Gibberella zeae (strain ATCC MYA-4620 / CBS 123657 / FGSC 9075 / NRRL 31084 / PH-1) TaxID=229533 RepID=A0A098D553_GIBZE|nr:unnamed protein product [Fusarium graminearum]CZS76846.1 unnamed protein product [Fusarium graminearum]